MYDGIIIKNLWDDPQRIAFPLGFQVPINVVSCDALLNIIAVSLDVKLVYDQHAIPLAQGVYVTPESKQKLLFRYFITRKRKQDSFIKNLISDLQQETETEVYSEFLQERSLQIFHDTLSMDMFIAKIDCDALDILKSLNQELSDILFKVTDKLSYKSRTGIFKLALRRVLDFKCKLEVLNKANIDSKLQVLYDFCDKTQNILTDYLNCRSPKMRQGYFSTLNALKEEIFSWQQTIQSPVL